MTLEEAIKRYTSNAFYEKSDGNLQGYLEFNQLADWLKELRKYRSAFQIACELLNGSILYGYDTDRIFEEIMEKDGVVLSNSYEEFILNNLDRLSGKSQIKAESEGKTGHWIENAPECQNIDPPYICSECGNMHLRKTNYCDQCGAKMVGHRKVRNEHERRKL